VTGSGSVRVSDTIRVLDAVFATPEGFQRVLDAVLATPEGFFVRRADGVRRADYGSNVG
jgi:hypothetical protein